ncbi:uncharacterized protein ASCRUDRAFT_74665 [Ascoidea rubescens DSM 1968]|uniref:Uncharacterized protein n=1 Tax=Ascoidea rubescens DSM 1968 TaxID=1344418 RepID=A0A1D2VKV8_9ASCO|nr:hypothetical protein ASCRUDRAFT_74665 [Ascoidea rubescens DSM 1968]ODV62240.1 hypothetical protein ASCRUDRAFT_74665 [Ascoidea rubescens DSM 1968]
MLTPRSRSASLLDAETPNDAPSEPILDQKTSAQYELPPPVTQSSPADKSKFKKLIFIYAFISMFFLFGLLYSSMHSIKKIRSNSDEFESDLLASFANTNEKKIIDHKFNKYKEPKIKASFKDENGEYIESQEIAVDEDGDGVAESYYLIEQYLVLD